MGKAVIEIKERASFTKVEILLANGTRYTVEAHDDGELRINCPDGGFSIHPVMGNEITITKKP